MEYIHAYSFCVLFLWLYDDPSCNEELNIQWDDIKDQDSIIVGEPNPMDKKLYTRLRSNGYCWNEMQKKPKINLKIIEKKIGFDQR